MDNEGLRRLWDHGAKATLLTREDIAIDLDTIYRAGRYPYRSHADDALRYAMTGRTMHNTRKDTTMAYDTKEERAQKLASDIQDDLGALVDLLGDMAKEEPDPPKKRTILDEKWEKGPDSGTAFDIFNDHKVNVCRIWQKQYANAIEALPDCLRALVMVDNHLEHNRDYSPEQCMSIFITPAVYSAIKAALKKAGVS